MCGVDLTRIDGIDVTTALAVISEIGTDMSRFPDGQALRELAGFVSGHQDHRWQGDERQDQAVCQPRGPGPALAAAALRTSQSALGAYFRRMCARMDKPKAVTAAAHKLARLIYTMLTKGEEYTDQGQDYYEERYRQRVLRRRACSMNRWMRTCRRWPMRSSRPRRQWQAAKTSKSPNAHPCRPTCRGARSATSPSPPPAPAVAR
jgi:transposase